MPPDRVATTFALGCLGALLMVSWRAQDPPAIWPVLSIPLGLVGLFVPFGDATVNINGACPTGFGGFCGEGVPVPAVIWDKGADYPDPLAVILNPLLLGILGLIVIVLLKGIKLLIGKMRKIAIQ